MLDIAFIRENPDKVVKAVQSKGLTFDVDNLLKIDEERRTMIQEVDVLRAEQNKVSVSIASLSGKEKEKKIADSAKLKKQLSKREAELRRTQEVFFELMDAVPNIPFKDVPIGKDESANKVLRKWGKPTSFDFKPKDHMEIGEELDIIDTKKASEVSGTRFAYLKGGAALLEFALIHYAFEILTSEKIIKKIASSVKKGYSSTPFIPVVPPVIIRPEVLSQMARLSGDDKDERYYLKQDDLYLVGSAEHTLGPLHMKETLEEKELPKRYVGFSTSFRREAGSYGKDTKGILRVHQFDKVEIESFTTGENSLLEQEFIVALQEYLMQSLKLPYQVVLISTGDMGKPDARQIDIETWMPGQDLYRETHSSDLMTDYQARRLNIRVRFKDGTKQFVHMNDATVFAIGRMLIAILENYQKKDGSVKIPAVLQKYVGVKEIKKST
ncbi:MAG: serine--tRNA ligase [Patescibacteria group bacterium]|nr:serine--tRNA ligase [Patescibacteria group bacterium]